MFARNRWYMAGMTWGVGGSTTRGITCVPQGWSMTVRSTAPERVPTFSTDVIGKCKRLAISAAR
jgi:hypothetical protein